MVSQATEIKDLIETNWDSQDNLNDRLSKVPLDNMKEIVRFFDRNQVEGNEWPKAVVVRKINDDEKEDRTVHPNFIELTDKYEITVYYRVIDVQEQSYSEALDDVESMGTEVQRILDLEFDPSTMTGPWFTANYFWNAADHLDSNQPELRRTVKMTLYQIVGIGDKVYSGFDGTLIFDTSDSSGDNLPVSDFTYQAVTNVAIEEGWQQISYLTKDQTSGSAGVPFLGRGAFAGTFVALTYANQDDLEGTTLDKIPQMYLPQTNTSLSLAGEQGDVVFAYNTTNPAGSVITTKSFLKISNIQMVSGDKELVQYKITGNLTKPSVVSFS